MNRDEELYAFDSRYSFLGCLAGLDEAGRGPLAGPVVAAAVILPADTAIAGLNDSKKLSPNRREKLAEIMRCSGAQVGIGMASPAEIDRCNILQATFNAMRRAVARLPQKPSAVLVDGDRTPRLGGMEVRAFTGGDGKSASIAAASIAAKVYRDELMRRYEGVYPGYGFARHKGYGTPEHLEALERLGPCPIHRMTFAPLSPPELPSDRGSGAGGAAENAACEYLKKRGYQIRERNYKVRAGEVDIIAEQGGLLVFVEVKMRSPGVLSVSPREVLLERQRRRIIRAAETYLVALRPERLCRFDFLEVVPEGEGYRVKEHLENAFGRQG